MFLQEDQALFTTHDRHVDIQKNVTRQLCQARKKINHVAPIINGEAFDRFFFTGNEIRIVQIVNCFTKEFSIILIVIYKEKSHERL
jgi:hypothetical protein